MKMQVHFWENAQDSSLSSGFFFFFFPVFCFLDGLACTGAVVSSCSSVGSSRSSSWSSASGFVRIAGGEGTRESEELVEMIATVTAKRHPPVD